MKKESRVSELRPEEQRRIKKKDFSGRWITLAISNHVLNEKKERDVILTLALGHPSLLRNCETVSFMISRTAALAHFYWFQRQHLVSFLSVYRDFCRLDY